MRTHGQEENQCPELVQLVLLPPSILYALFIFFLCGVLGELAILGVTEGTNLRQMKSCAFCTCTLRYNYIVFHDES